VISNNLFNRHTGLCVACPVTNTRRDYPFHVPIPDNERIAGFVMVEQVKSIDFHSRKAKRIGKAPEQVLQEALSLLDAVIY
jgi:mRNA interferase MazF